MSDGQQPSEGVVPNTAMMFAYISEERTVIEEKEETVVVEVQEEAQQEIQQEDHTAYEDDNEEEDDEEERLPTTTTTTTNVEETNENGFNDVVPASLAEVSGREETHTAHLVEGDFFPEDSPSRVELRNADERSDSTAKDLPQQQEEEEQYKEEEKEKEQKQEQEDGSMGEREKTPQYRHSVREKKEVGEGKKGSDVCTSWYTITRRSVKRVRWADEVVVAAPLVQHATTFFLPLGDQTQQHQQQQQQQSMLYGETDKVLQTFSPPPVLREEKNSDGTTYLSCRAQRPAKRFVMWKRGVAASGHNAEDPPFKLQPLGNRPPIHSTTLLAALHPPYHAENVGTTVQMRVATISQDAKKGGALCDSGLQMPMVRSSQLLNVPLCIPF